LGITEGDPNFYELLEYEWVLLNTKERFTKLLTENYYCRKWIPLPAGASRGSKQRMRMNSQKKNAKRSNLKKLVDDEVDRYNCMVEACLRENPVLTDDQISSTWPTIRYQQNQGENFCMFYSFASALDWMGQRFDLPEFVALASLIHDLAPESVKDTITSDQRCLLLRQIIDGSFQRKKGHSDVHSIPLLAKNATFIQTTKPKYVFDPRDKRNQRLHLTLAVCESVDGSIEHAVTFVGKWLFDANERRALEISTLALNRCVPYGYKRIFRGWIFGKLFLKENRTRIEKSTRKMVEFDCGNL